MRAAVYEEFGGPISVRTVPDPSPSSGGVVLAVKACGICRSDWHGWVGNDPDIEMPHVPGHELSGAVAAVGSDVKKWNVGDRVTLPFICGCGTCEFCIAGDQQVCDRQFQPGFTAWGGFAEYVAIDRADGDLVALPEEIDFTAAASLGCRFAASYRAVVDQASVEPGQWVAVYGCGGVGLSSIMIASAMNARVIAVDISEDKLRFARAIGAEISINSRSEDPVAEIQDITAGGAHISIDALGHAEIVTNSLLSLRKRGKHIQIGILDAGDPDPLLPMNKIMGRELEIIGSHGMQAHRYPQMLKMIVHGSLDPKRLVERRISLDESTTVLREMNSFAGNGIAVIDRF